MYVKTEELINAFDRENRTYYGKDEILKIINDLSENKRPLLTYNDYTLNPKRYTVTNGGVENTLTKKEFDIMYYLMEKRGEIVTRDELLNELWIDAIVDDRAIDVHLCKIKKVVKDLIKTKKGVGYIIE